MNSQLKSGLALVFVGLLVASTAGTAAAVLFNADADMAPQPRITTQVTKDTHVLGDNATTYEADDGSEATLAASVNSSYDNPFGFVASDVNNSDFGEYPHSNDSIEVTDAGEWTSDLTGSAGSGSVSQSSTAPGVEAVQVSTSSQTSGDVALFTFDAASVTSDEQKRMLQAVGDVNALDAGASVEIRYVDADGDYYAAEINSSRTTGADLAANSTTDGFVWQHKAGEMTLVADGDGSYNDLEKITVAVSDGDATVTLAGANADRMSPWVLGEEKADTDSDDELETVTIEETMGGTIWVHNLSTLGPSFDGEEIHDLQMWMDFQASDRPDKDLDAEFTQDDPSAPSYYGTSTMWVRFELPDAYDLAYSSAELVVQQPTYSDRYASVEYASGVGDTDLGNISEDSYSDISGSYSSKGANVTIDNTLQPGETLVLKYNQQWQQSEFKALKSVPGGPGGFGGSGSGGLWGFLTNPFVAIASLLGALGVNKKRKSGGGEQ